jgi:NAD(P)-dependent dehydrogenase (short-subunit alcohol dehydrogenase family)
MQAVAKEVTGSSASSSNPKSPGIVVNAVCPSLCKTDLGRNFGTMSHISGFFFQGLFARTAEEGSRSLVSATALGPESHGRFWHHDILAP